MLAFRTDAFNAWSANHGLVLTMNLLALTGYLGTKAFDLTISRVTGGALFPGRLAGYATWQMAYLASIDICQV